MQTHLYVERQMAQMQRERNTHCDISECLVPSVLWWQGVLAEQQGNGEFDAEDGDVASNLIFQQDLSHLTHLNTKGT